MTTRYARTAEEILKGVGCPSLKSERINGAEGGSWLWIYEREIDGGLLANTEMILTFRLNHVPLDKFVEWGKTFVQQVEAEYAAGEWPLIKDERVLARFRAGA